jgi:hypothetical protein
MKKEKSHLTQPAQRRYKKQRRKNDIYTTMGGHKNPKSGHPFSGSMKRFGTDPLRFEGLRITKTQLKQIIKEELAAVLSERQQLEEGRFERFTAAAVLAAMLGLGGLQSKSQSDYDQLRAQAEQRLSDSRRIEQKTKQMIEQLKNAPAWTWTDDRRSRKTFPSVKFSGRKYYVLPPEWTVYYQATEDKMRIAEDRPTSVEELREYYRFLPNPNNMPEGATTVEDMIKSFNKRSVSGNPAAFVPKDGSAYDDTGLAASDGTPILMIKWSELSSFEGKLPVLGLTVEEAYIDFSFGSMLSEEEKSIILGGLSPSEDL